MRKLGLTCLMVILMVSAYAQSDAQKITIRKSRITVEQVLKQIADQSGRDFSYNPKSIGADKVIKYKIRKASLEEALDELMAKVPIEYSILEDQIIINKRGKSVELSEAKVSPEYYSLSGFVNDKTSGESLIGATVYARGTAVGTSTNGFGYYSLRLPKGNFELEYGYLGFDSERKEVSIEKDEKIDIDLKNTPLKLPNIIVKTPISDLIEKKQLGGLTIKKNDFGRLPEFGGESGLIRGLQAFPGIKTHSDGSAFFFVRGGEKDQNLIIIDDAPIYNPAHLFGFYSMIVPEFTKDIKLYKTDIPVHLGDRLSSIVDVRTKDGNLNKFELNGAFNPLLTQISLEGPIVKEKSSFFASWRTSNFKWIYQDYAPDLDLRFGDFQFKWNYKLTKKDRLFITLINGGDLLSNTGGITGTSAGIQWNNFATTLRWNRIFNSKLFMNTVLYTGNYQYKLSQAQDVWHSGIGKLSLKSDFSYFNNARLKTKFGLELHGYGFNPGKILTESLSRYFPTIKQDLSRQVVLYYDANYKLAKKWQTSLGARLSNWANLGPAEYYTFDEDYLPNDTVSAVEGVYNQYWRMDPRTSITYNVDSSSSLKLSYGLYHQYLQLISNSTSPFTSFEVWLPSSANIKPQRAHQVALGYVKYFPKQGLEFSTEAYYKRMSNQIDYEDHAQTLLNPYIEGELRFGKMRSYGIEMMLKKNLGRLNGWLSYTYSRALRQTDEINAGEIYPAFHDRPHDFSMMLNYRLKRRILFSAYYTAYTGSAFSSPTGFYTFKDNTVPIYGEKHNDRLPDYRRLDLAFEFTLNKNPESKFQHSLTFSVYNALAHKNIVAVNFNKTLKADETPIINANALNNKELVTTQADLIRFLPSLTYRFKR